MNMPSSLGFLMSLSGKRRTAKKIFDFLTRSLNPFKRDNLALGTEKRELIPLDFH